MPDSKMPEERLTTTQLLRKLKKSYQLSSFLKENEDSMYTEPFHEYISELCRMQNKKAAQVIALGNIEASYAYQIFKGKRNPSRDTVIQLAFGFEANLELAQELLRRAGMSQLYPRVPRDVAIIYCLHHKIPFVRSQTILSELGFKPVGVRGNDE